MSCERGGKRIMTKLGNISSLPMLLFVLLALQACVAGKQLRTDSAAPASIQGTYDLYLYGCRYSDDIENAAILVDVSSGYPFEVFARETLYKVKKGLSAEQALAEANTFIRCSFYTVWQTRLRSISDDAGKTVGFDLVPRYNPLEFGTGDIMLISYALRNGTITAYIREDPARENSRLFSDDHGAAGSGNGGGGR
jgi:hypothetical protein